MTFGISFGIGSRTIRYGFYIGIDRQCAGAPLVDQTTTVVRNAENNAELARYKGKGILLTPWKRNQYGDREAQKMLVFAKQVA